VTAASADPHADVRPLQSWFPAPGILYMVPQDGTYSGVLALRPLCACRYTCQAAAPSQPSILQPAEEQPKKVPIAKQMDDRLHAYLLQHTREPQVQCLHAVGALLLQFHHYILERLIACQIETVDQRSGLNFEMFILRSSLTCGPKQSRRCP
jgi:hypothetical protein